MPADVSSSAPPRAIPLDYRQVPWTSRLIRDYCFDFDQLDAFFVGSPQAPDTWTAAFAARRAKPPDPGVSAAVVRQLTARHAPPAAVAQAARLGDAGTVAVVTGQQAGLFGGPLFTLLKALTAIRLARRLEAEHGTAVVPLFWVDAEDHDLDEVATCTVLDADQGARAVTLPLTAPARTTASSVVLDDTMAAVVGELRAILPPTEFTDDVLSALTAAYAPPVRLTEAFARWMDRLLGAQGLVVYEASDPSTKPYARPLFAREIDTGGEAVRLAAAAATALTGRGYHAQAAPAADTLALFRLDGTRESIRVERGGLRVGTRTFSTAELLAAVEARPESFSPNVLLRPLTQDSLFPTVAYVAGPSELAYLGQLRRVYDAFDVPMPVIYPRASLTVVDAATIKFLSRYDVDFPRLQAQDDAALNALLEAQLPATVDAAMTHAMTAVDDRLGALDAAVPTIDPTLAGAVASTRGRVERELRNLRGKILQAAKRRNETLRRQFARARAQSFPDGDLQERRVAGIHFLNRYGFAFIDRLLDELPLEPGHHWLVTL